jgi:hypothetical protein
VMERDAKKLRGVKPVIFTSLRRGEGVGDVIRWIRREVLFEDITGGGELAAPRASAMRRVNGRVET